MLAAHLLIGTEGSKYWRLAYSKKWLAQGWDPSRVKKEQKLAAVAAAECTFEVVALQWCRSQKKGWTENHAARVEARLKVERSVSLHRPRLSHQVLHCVALHGYRSQKS